MTDPCLFCSIVRNEIKSNSVFSDDQVIAFRDIHPVAPTHILIVPRRHIRSMNDIRPEDEGLIGHMFTIASQLARQENIHEGGYRIIVNTGPDGGQTIFHLHLHLIGGEPMKHPMG
jgi:histidine triad (HIT) family protein